MTGQTASPPTRTPALGDEVRRANRLAAQVKLGPTYRRVFLLIAGFIDAGHPDPSWRELATRAGFEKTTVRNAIKRLERRRVLAVQRPGPPERDRYELRDLGGDRR